MALSSCKGENTKRLEELARTGNIQQDAPVVAVLQIVIDAPVERVWQLLTDIDAWPRWQSDIRQAKIIGRIEPGSSFTWSSGMTIQSRLAMVQPPFRLAWTGKAMGATAIHVWELQRLPGNQTLLRTKESMNGLLLPLFYSSAKLKQSDQQWLDNLKHAAER